MDILAYTDAYAAHEVDAGITYDYSEIQLWQATQWRSLSHGLFLTMLSMGLIAGAMTVTSPALAQVLRPGDAGNSVAEVQTLLRNKGFQISYGANGGGRGKFGPQTTDAVRKFQQQSGLAVDGVVGPNTWAKLRGTSGGVGGPSPSRPTSGGSTGLLGKGSKGEQVAEVQTLLRNKGYSISYGADGSGRGYYGDDTVIAVRSFQQNAGLSVDGVVGPRTIAALRGSPMPAPTTTTPRIAQGQYRINTNSKPLNVRTGPGEQYSVAQTLANGTRVNVIGQANGWAQIAPGRYVSSRFIQQM
ncbi:peptidoglycan-binding protein [Spirulina major]|uniref:peptidoglycan-binding protein n=1 Tax=Spirulina major TaxID=270636 RepID=UPI0009325575|nr:peptidoglycan-binding protein [Spirulina major]